jgi:hypothetical protein
MPMQGIDHIHKLHEANKWADIYFPNFIFKTQLKKDKPVSHPIKLFFEFLLNNKFGDRLDNYFLKLTSRRWQLKEKQGRLNTKGENMGLKTSKHCSKPNPVFFHDQFLKKLENRLKEEKIRWDL